MNKYKLVVFDWDGTLVNSIPVVIHIFQTVAHTLHLEVPEIETIRKHIGLEFKSIVNALFPNVDMDKFTHCYTKAHDENWMKIEMYDHAREVLYYLQNKGYLLAVSTNRQRRPLQRMIDRFNVNDFFVDIKCGDEECAKPDPKMLSDIFDNLSVSPQDAILVGDSIYDMQLANNAGAHVIAACYGTESTENLLQYSPNMHIRDIKELQGLL